MIRQRVKLTTLGILVCWSAAWTPAARAQNPMLDWLRGFRQDFRSTADEIEQSQNSRDQLDVRPAQSQEDNRQLSRAAQLLADQKWNEGIDVIQFLLDESTDSFSFRTGRRFVSLHADADRMLSELPPDARRLYESRFSGAANILLEEAKRTQSEDQLVALTNRYFHTPAGRSAQELLVHMWRSRGDLGAAAGGLQRLAATSEGEVRRKYQRELAFTLAEAGRAEEAQAVAADLDAATRQQLAVAPPLGNVQPSPNWPPYITSTVERLPVADTEPLPTARWSADLIERYAVAQRIEQLQADLRDAGRVLIPTAQPLVVDNLVAYRTLRGLQVRDVRTGELEWERRTADSTEERILEEGGRTEIMRYSLRLRNRLLLQDGSLGEQHQLASLMYRDGVYASLSSDGRRLFGIEDHGSASFDAPLRRFNFGNDGAQDRDAQWSTNMLAAYDLETGRVLWRVGGEASSEDFGGRLSGTFFFGAPVPSDGELLCIAEREGEVQLVVLSPQTGEELWSLPLAVPGSALTQDVVRRQWVCQPAIADGYLLCPTTSGWFVAVERHSRRLAWTFRYAPRFDGPGRREMRAASPVHVLKNLDERWDSPRPIIHGRQVIIAPPELPDEMGVSQPAIFALDIATGKQVWSVIKQEDLYLAGVWNDTLLTVGPTSVSALRTQPPFSIKWKAALPIRASGRALLFQDSLLIPAEGGKLMRVDLAAVSPETKVIPLAARELGNLAIAGRDLVAANYNEIAVFTSEASLRDGAGTPEQLARADLARAQQLILREEFAPAEALLRELEQRLPAAAELRTELRRLQWTASEQLAQRDAAGGSDAVSRLRELAVTEDEQLTVRRLSADALRKQGNAPAAAAALLALLDVWPIEKFIAEGSREMRIDSWVGGRLSKLYQSLPEADRPKFETELRAILDASPPAASRRDLPARALSFCQVGDELELELAREAQQRGRVAEALLRLKRVAESTSPVLQAGAVRQLAELLETEGWTADAIAAWERLASLPELELDGENSRRLAERKLFGLRSPDEAPPRVVPFPSPWAVEQTGTSVEPGTFRPAILRGRGFQELDRLRLLAEVEKSRLRIEELSTGRLLTSLPLRERQDLEYVSEAEVTRLGPLLIVVRGGVLHAVAWPDDTVLWTHMPDLRGADPGAVFSRSILRTPSGRFRASDFVQRQQLGGDASQTGLLAAASPRLLLLGTREWTALDPLTGEVLWRDRARNPSMAARVAGPLHLFARFRGARELRSVLDGELETAPSRAGRLVDMIDSVDGEPILLRIAAGSSDLKLSRETVAGDVRWSVEIAEATRVDRPTSDLIYWLTRTGSFHIVTLPDGQTVEMDRLPAELNQQQQLTVLTDRDLIFVLINQVDAGYSPVNLESTPFRGTLAVYERTGKLLWSKVIVPDGGGFLTNLLGLNVDRNSPLSLVLEDFDVLPALLFVREMNGARDGIHINENQIIAYDKRTGATLLDWKRASETSGFVDMFVNLQQRTIDLRTYGALLRLRSGAEIPEPVPAEPPAPAQPPAQEPPPADDGGATP